MNTQLTQDIETLNKAPYDRPLSDKENEALDRCIALERKIGVLPFQKLCAEECAKLEKAKIGLGKLFGKRTLRLSF